MPKAVKYSRYGGPDVLEVAEIDMPEPGFGEVLIEVVAAGLNPADSRLREGLLADTMPARFPQGQGSDFAGLVRAKGPGVTQCEVNDAVIGHASRASHATHLTVPATNLTPKPPTLPWEVAGGLFVTGITAWAAINALNVSAGDTLVVSAAAGGVGCIAAQLARLRGATVLGTAGAQNADFLRQIGVIPIDHDADIVARIHAHAPDGVDAYLDAFGRDNLSIAHHLGVSPSRIRSVLDWDGVHEYGPDEYGIATKIDPQPSVHTASGDEQLDAVPITDGTGTDVVARLARLAAQHRLLVPIADIFAIEQVQQAFEELDRGHARGKIVLGMHPVNYPHQRVREATLHGVALKEAASTVGVPTVHQRMNVQENLPPVVGHLPGQRHPHPSDEPVTGR